MRISTNTIFETNVLALNQAQAKFFHTQQQVSTGRRILTASDDPVAATRALEVSQSDDTNTQYAANRTNTINALTTSEANLQGVSALLQDVRDLVITSGQSSLSSAERATFANELQSKLQELIGLANSTDQAGNHMYSGFQTRTQPFVNTPAGVIYMGDDGQRKVQVSASLQLESSDNGADIFMRIKSGNGTFVTAAAGANTGTGVVSLGSVVDTTALTGDNYRVDFTVTGGVTTYSVTDTTTATTVLTAQPYVSGQVISFDGIQFDIKGAPANGDSFTVSPSTNESVFKTISDLVAALNTPVVGANLQNSLSHGIRNVDNALNNVMNVRGAIGLRLNHIDTLAETGVNLGLQYKQTLSTLQDVDYNQAAANLAQQQLMLQAAQQSFVRVAGLSMFNYL